MGLSPAVTELHVSPKRNPLLRELYGRGIARADERSFFLSDKLAMAREIFLGLGGEAEAFHPRATGLKEFLARNELVEKNGEWRASRGDLRSALRREFPEGCVLKACFGFGSKRGSFFHGEEALLEALHGPEAEAYAPARFPLPHRAPPEFAGGISSGEEYFLMGLVPGTTLAGERETGAVEIRAHSFGRKAVPGATLARWDTPCDLAAIAPRAHVFLEDFLARMPATFSEGQGFAYDLLVPEQGEAGLRILEVNTNRGRQISWSDYLRDPAVLAAHARFFEAELGWRFLGREGEALRLGLGNVVNHLRADLACFLADERRQGRSEFWTREMYQRNRQLALALLDFHQGEDHFGYFAEAGAYARLFLEKLAGPRDAFLAWAAKDIGAEGEAL